MGGGGGSTEILPRRHIIFMELTTKFLPRGLATKPQQDNARKKAAELLFCNTSAGASPKRGQGVKGKSARKIFGPRPQTLKRRPLMLENRDDGQ